MKTTHLNDGPDNNHCVIDNNSLLASEAVGDGLGEAKRKEKNIRQDSI